MTNSTPEQLRFPPIDSLSIRADFKGGALSTDIGPMLLRAVDRQVGLSDHLARAFDDRRHASYTGHPLPDLSSPRWICPTPNVSIEISIVPVDRMRITSKT